MLYNYDTSNYDEEDKGVKPVEKPRKPYEDEQDNLTEKLSLITLLMIMWPLSVIEILDDFAMKIWDNIKKVLHLKPKKPHEEPKPIVLEMKNLKCEKTDFPFVFSYEYFVFIEHGYNEVVNNYIRQHLDEIREQGAKHGYKFLYIPEITNIPKEELTSIFPSSDKAFLDMAYDKIRGITTAQFTKAFLDSIGISPDKCNCGFMRLYTYVPNKENGEFIDRHCFPVVFRYADLNISDENLMDAAMPQLYESFFEKLKLGLYCVTIQR